MRLKRMTIAVAFMITLCGCATVQYGDKETEAKLRELLPIPGKTSLYVCREAAVFSGAGSRTTVIVDSRAIGTLKPNNFAHIVVDPGSHDIYIKRTVGDSGTHTINSKAGEVAIVWVGMTGKGFGVLTVDAFSSRTEAEQCVKGAQYAVPTEP